MTSKQHDMAKIFRYGYKIGAEQVMFQNGEIRAYYKKGTKASKYMSMCYTNNKHGRPLEWTSSHEYAVQRIADFMSNLGHDMALINLPLPPPPTPEQIGQQHEPKK